MLHGFFVGAFDEFAEPATLLDLARLAEDRGWDGVFLWDHLQRPEVRPVADPWVMLAAIATVTHRVRIGPMVTPLTRRRPQKLAREVATLDRLSGGRVVLGLGLGVDSGRELSAFGEVTDGPTRGRMLDEGISVLRGLLSGDEVVHRGEHYTADEVRFVPIPIQRPCLPIWLAARTAARRPLLRAAHNDGLFIIEKDAAEIASMLEVVAAERGSLEGFDVATVALPGLDPAEFGAAGVTWWMSGPVPGESLDDVMALADAGPPRSS